MNQNILDRKKQLEQEIEVAKSMLLKNFEAVSLSDYFNPTLPILPATSSIISGLTSFFKKSDTTNNYLNQKQNSRSYFDIINKIISILKN